MKRGLFRGVLLTLLGSNDVAAQSPSRAPPPDKLEWTAPDECPTRAQVFAEIERIAARRIEREFRARVTVRRGPSGEYRGQVSLQVGAAFDERHVEGATCAEIADASALLIALALEPETRSADPPPQRTQVAAPPGGGNPTSHQAKLYLGVTLALEALALPRPISTVRPALGISSGRVLLSVEGLLSPSVGESLAEEPQKGADFRLLGARFAGCWIFGRGALRASPCAGVGVMGIGTQAFGVSRTRDAITWTPNLTAEARLIWSPRPRFEGLLAVVLGVPAERLEFSVDSASGSRHLYSAPPLTLAVGIGISRLWDLF